MGCTSGARSTKLSGAVGLKRAIEPEPARKIGQRSDETTPWGPCRIISTSRTRTNPRSLTSNLPVSTRVPMVMTAISNSPSNVRNKYGKLVDKGMLYKLLRNPIYIGEAVHKGVSYPGEHAAILDRKTWDKVQAAPADRSSQAIGSGARPNTGPPERAHLWPRRRRHVALLPHPPEGTTLSLLRARPS
jgi:hypothetical protein